MSNEMKPEDVMRSLEEWIYNFNGTAKQFCALCDAIAILREKDALIKMLDEDRLGWAEEAVKVKMQVNEKDAEIERLKTYIDRFKSGDEHHEARAEAITEFFDRVCKEVEQTPNANEFFINAWKSKFAEIAKEVKGE